MRIRDYQDADAPAVGRLISATYREYNLSHADLEEQDRLLGPFQHAFSDDPSHREAIRSILQSPMLYIAEADDEIVGVLRGRENVLASLFVCGDRHRQGIGRALVSHFERESVAQGVTRLRVAATLFAVPFYTAVGFRKSTGVRPGRSFDGTNFTYQPMRKALT
ncbi:GNAT family N-acetyltransferase [Candidatus Bipolaricaulota bacterium]|nr:GNAT family N-acetyltransferase [Candidatus Bipolaricaulota bacterium]